MSVGHKPKKRRTIRAERQSTRTAKSAPPRGRTVRADSATTGAAKAGVSPTSTDQRLSLIARMTGAVVGSKPLARLAREMAGQARAAFGVDACVIRLLERNQLVLLASAGVPKKQLHPRIPVGWGVSRRIISRRKALFIPDVRVDPSMSRALTRVIRLYDFTSYAGAPLIVKNRVIGIFAIYSVKGIREFSAADLSCLQIFGNNIAAAIVNERSYEEMKRQRDQVRAETAERRRAEKALRASEQRYRAVVEDQSEFICRHRDNGVITFVNEAACQSVGSTSQELIGRSFFEFLGEEGVVAVRKQLASLDRDHPVATIEHRILRRGGEVRWHQWTNHAIFDMSGRVVEYQAVGRDITERRWAEQALRESEAKYRALIEMTDTGFVILDADGRVLDANAEYVRLTGHDALREILGKRVTEWTARHDVGRNAEEVRNCLARGSVRNLELDYVGREGKHTPIEVNATALQTAEGARILGLCRDITERKRAEQERELSSVRLREAHKLEALGRFGRGVAHDFNNLMATVLGLASNMKLSRRSDHPDYAKLAHIEEAAETAARLAHQLLAFAKGGKIQPRLLPFADVVKSALALVPPMVPRNVSLDHQIASGLWQVECDQTQIQQVIVNLCRNALEAMPNGGCLTIKAENTTLSSSLDDAQPALVAGDYVCLAVRDTGYGMTPETMKRMFDPFFTTKEHGHGLGLAAAHGIMGAHGGGLSVTSEWGKGSVFRMWLPRAHDVGGRE